MVPERGTFVKNWVWMGLEARDQGALPNQYLTIFDALNGYLTIFDEEKLARFLTVFSLGGRGVR